MLEFVMIATPSIYASSYLTICIGTAARAERHSNADDQKATSNKLSKVYAPRMLPRNLELGVLFMTRLKAAIEKTTCLLDSAYIGVFTP